MTTGTTNFILRYLTKLFGATGNLTSLPRDVCGIALQLNDACLHLATLRNKSHLLTPIPLSKSTCLKSWSRNALGWNPCLRLARHDPNQCASSSENASTNMGSKVQCEMFLVRNAKQHCQTLPKHTRTTTTTLLSNAHSLFFFPDRRLQRDHPVTVTC